MVMTFLFSSMFFFCCCWKIRFFCRISQIFFQLKLLLYYIVFYPPSILIMNQSLFELFVRRFTRFPRLHMLVLLCRYQNYAGGFHEIEIDFASKYGKCLIRNDKSRFWWLKNAFENTPKAFIWIEKLDSSFIFDCPCHAVNSIVEKSEGKKKKMNRFF